MYIRIWIRTFASILSLVLLLGCAPAPTASIRPLSIVLQNNVLDIPLAEFSEFFNAFRTAVLTNDRPALLKVIDIKDLTIHCGRHTLTLATVNDLYRLYDAIFTEELLQTLLTMSGSDFFVNEQGIMIGCGQVWFKRTAIGHYTVIINVETKLSPQVFKQKKSRPHTAIGWDQVSRTRYAVGTVSDLRKIGKVWYLTIKALRNYHGGADSLDDPFYPFKPGDRYTLILRTQPFKELKVGDRIVISDHEAVDAKGTSFWTGAILGLYRESKYLDLKGRPIKVPQPGWK